MAGAHDRTRIGQGTVVLASGGTGGHLFPAQALARELEARDWDVKLFTDARGLAWQDRFRAGSVTEVSSSTLTPGQPWKLPGQAYRLLNGYRQCVDLFTRLMPRAVVGFGGYPSLPVMMAARRAGIAAMIHEQNAVAGRANRLAASIGGAKIIATSFEPVYGFTPDQMKRVRLVGNPVREAVLEASAAGYEASDAAHMFNLLVFGGSQGAQYFSQVMPQVVAELPHAVKKRLRIVQQCRPEDIEAVRAAYEAEGVKATCESFFNDMPKRIAAAHLVICRAGASTVAELGVIGRPAIYVPLPHALDNDQLRNAESMTKAGGGWVMEQKDITPAGLAGLITRLRFDPVELTRAAQGARSHGRPAAAEALADLVAQLARPALAKDFSTT
jgi:UDP-N-acetylglucosamine--N-acetylmuramyl-(pentapeptide) pyrophosphoryl-undecaprenol N-acetylglucosamine transferase